MSVLVTKLVYARNKPVIGLASRALLKVFGIEIPPQVKIGRGLNIYHSGFGIVLHSATEIGNDVHIYHGVTLGRADAWVPKEKSRFRGFKVDDGAILCAGAIILCKEGVLTIGAGSIVGANSVLTKSTEPGEIWAGNPAKLIGRRKDGMIEQESHYE